MKKFLPLLLLLPVALNLSAQKLARFQALAITSPVPGSFDYTEIQLVNLHSGAVIHPLFTKNQEYKVVGSTGHFLTSKEQFKQADSVLHPTALNIGAAAYDAKHNRLFYTPLGLNQLRFINLNSGEPSFTYIDDAPFGVSKGKLDVPSQIARLVIDPSGNGYGLSNDGNHLVKFTTGDKVTITDLGAVSDNPKDSINGYRKTCSCGAYGGDMVADTKGDLYVITVNNNIYKLTLDNKIISYLGTIKGLPAGFSSNGAAVDEEGNLVVGCAGSTAALPFPYFMVDMKTFTATPFQAPGPLLNTADLATNNFLPVPGENLATNRTINKISDLIIDNKHISIYPNPVQGDRFTISFNGLEKGNYTLQLTDLQGRLMMQKNIQVASNKQSEQINTKATLEIKGSYMVNIISNAQKTVYNKKILVE
ncbi:MAG: C-terminal target protein [Chitinophagaceae bacterium]|nr:C-terminal target protein [Chitinophagaceae bacterium]